MCADGAPVEAGVNIVMVRDVIVAEDLVLTLSDMFPHFDAVSVANLTSLAEVLEPIHRIGVAVLEMSPADFRAGTLLSVLKTKGARILLLWTTDGDAPDADFSLLEKPFTTEALVALLRTER